MWVSLFFWGGGVQYLVTLLNLLFFFRFSHFIIQCLQFQRHSGFFSFHDTSQQSPALDLCGFCPVTYCSVLHCAAVVYNNTNEVCHVDNGFIASYLNWGMKNIKRACCFNLFCVKLKLRLLLCCSSTKRTGCLIGIETDGLPEWLSTVAVVCVKSMTCTWLFFCPYCIM